MKNASIKLIIVFIFSLLPALYASTNSSYFPQKTHIGVFKSESPKCTSGCELYLIETASGYVAVFSYDAHNPLYMGLYNGYFAELGVLDPDGTTTMHWTGIAANNAGGIVNGTSLREKKSVS